MLRATPAQDSTAGLLTERDRYLLRASHLRACARWLEAGVPIPALTPYQLDDIAGMLERAAEHMDGDR